MEGISAPLIPDDENSPVGKRLLFTGLVVGPAGSVQLRQDVLAACVRFGEEWHWIGRTTTKSGS
jgi:hypothetical protein